MPRSARLAPLGLATAAALALALRSLDFAQVFPGDGSVRLKHHDACLHARLGLYAFTNFPRVLTFDRYLAWPDGARVPVPPLFGWALAATARLAGEAERDFERVAAWASPVLSAATVVPVWAIGRSLGGTGVGLGAAWLFALLGSTLVRSSVGNPDHHAAVSLLAACWLASTLAELRPDARPARRAPLHAAVVAAMLLTWSGSALYLVLGEGARFVAGFVVAGRRDLLLAQAGSSLLAAAAVAPWLAVAADPARPFTATNLSWLHLAALLALAALCAGLAALEARRPAASALARGARAAGLGLAVAGGILAAWPGLREGIAPGAAFLAKEDAWAATNPEQTPLFARSSRLVRNPASALFGAFALLVPIAPLLAALRLREPSGREAALVVALWTTALCGLLLAQVRFAEEFSVPAAAVFAWTLSRAARWAATHLRLGPRAAAPLAAGAGLLCLAPTIVQVHAPLLCAALAATDLPATGPAAPPTPGESLWRFAEEVRRVTPETSGFLDAGRSPEYGILVPPTLGHSFLYIARRPLPANNLGPYLDEARFRDARAFYEASEAEEALAIARRLAVRYVVTAARARWAEGSFEKRLHAHDGRGEDDEPQPGDLRLVTEGPAGGQPLGLFFPRGRPMPRIPYKLFEFVEGARLEVSAPPRTAVAAEVELGTPLGRRFVFRTETAAGPDGVARLRLPYATDGALPVRALGAYALQVGDERRSLDVPDAAVREGRSLRAPWEGSGSRAPRGSGTRENAAAPTA